MFLGANNRVLPGAYVGPQVPISFSSSFRVFNTEAGHSFLTQHSYTHLRVRSLTLSLSNKFCFVISHSIMDFKTPCQITLGVLLAAMALSVLGLAADNISFVNGHQSPSPVDIHYTRWNETAKAQYSYWVKIDYLPSRFTLGQMDAMLAASIISVLVGAGVAVSAWTTRGKNATRKTLILTGLASIAFAVSLAVAIYAWYPVMQYPIIFRNSLPYPSSFSTASNAGEGAIVYQSPFAYTPEVWNCLLAPYVVQQGQSQRMQGLCQEAKVAKDLMIPVVLLSAALLSCLLWSWRKERQATSDTENNGAKEIEEVSVQGKE